MLNKKLTLIVLVIFLIFGCATLDKSLFRTRPTAKIENFDIASISFQDITFRLNVAIKNPYPIAINLSKITSIFLIEKNQLFSAETEKGLRISANSESINPIDVTLKYSDIIKIIKDLSKNDYLNCEINGDIILAIPDTGIPGIPKSLKFPYKVTKKIPIIMPSISIKNFSIEKPSNEEVMNSIKKSGNNLNPITVMRVITYLLAGDYDKAFKLINPNDIDLKFDVVFNVEMNNRTKVPIKFDELSYNCTLAGDTMIKGTTSNIISKRNITIMMIRNRISLKSFSKSLVNVLKNKKGDFNLQGNTYIKLPDEIKKEPLKLNFDQNGKFNL